MTDTYVEEVIIKKFLELQSLEAVPKCYKYFNANKENENSLVSFQAFKPDYKNTEYGDISSSTEPVIPTEPELPDFSKLNPETELPYTQEEISVAKEKFQSEKIVYDTKVSEHEEWDDKRSHIEGPFLTDLINWYRDIYVNIYNDSLSDGWNIDDDALYSDIKNTSITINEETPIRRTIKIYEDGKNKSDMQVYPNVAFQNEKFIRPVDDSGNNTFWYELYFIPGVPDQFELGTKGRVRWVGIMQINICIPKTWGTQELNSRYDEIASLFRMGVNLSGVRITKVYRAAALDDEDYYCLPVTISWWADLER